MPFNLEIPVVFTPLIFITYVNSIQVLSGLKCKTHFAFVCNAVVQKVFPIILTILPDDAGADCAALGLVRPARAQTLTRQPGPGG